MSDRSFIRPIRIPGKRFVITKGMIALFVRVLNGESPEDVITADLSFIDQTGLKEHLAPV